MNTNYLDEFFDVLDDFMEWARKIGCNDPGRDPVEAKKELSVMRDRCKAADEDSAMLNWLLTEQGQNWAYNWINQGKPPLTRTHIVGGMKIAIAINPTVKAVE